MRINLKKTIKQISKGKSNTKHSTPTKSNNNIKITTPNNKIKHNNNK